jgi:hypothetical protein
MSLSAGGRLGPYEILAPIGAGGMGEVYRARDTKLDRDVAIKVLPAALAQDPERLARFEREAKVLASLNHPNIAQIYGIEDRALVMELVDGQTLRGPLPLGAALNYAKQIGDALEAAHDKGIVHRDLKPANVMITPAGVVKVLDFGLAAVSQSSDPSDPANSPTLTISPTRAGMILGTAAYMSPEQARGKPVDKRADIWAFGVVLHEMLTGRPLFEGETVSDTLAQVLTKEPDWEQVPARVRRLLKKCLEKDPKERLRDIGDARELLEENEPSTTASRSRMGTTGWIAALVTLAVIAGVALWGWLNPATPAPKPVTRFTTQLPYGVDTVEPALSRDGLLLAIPSGPGKPIYLRRMDHLEARALPGTEGAGGVAFSPDGQWIAFRTSGSQGLVKKIPVEGGAALTLVDGIPGVPELDWGLDDYIYFCSSTELLRVSSNGGKPQTLLTADLKKGELQYASPQLLPGGKEVLVGRLTTKGFTQGQIVALNLQTGETKTLVEGSLRARYAATGVKPETGLLVYGLNGVLLAVPFEVNGLKAASAAPVLEGVAGFGPVGEFGISDSGSLAYVPGDTRSQDLQVTLLWVDRQGKEQPIAAPSRNYGGPGLQLSPDNRRVVLDALDLQRFAVDLWVFDLARGNQPRITFEGSNFSPVWTPDGKRLIYLFSRDVAGQQNPEIRSVPADSSAPPTTLLASETPLIPLSVSPDGKLLMGIRNKAGPNLLATAGDEIWVLPLDASGEKSDAKPRAFVEPEPQFVRDNPRFSPDGKSVAYQANDSGRDEIYVVPYPGPGGRQQASTDGGTEPRWSRNGRELFYRNADKIMVVDVQISPSVHVTGTPKMLFEKASMGYDVSADGKRFLMLRRGAPSAQSNQINVVLNWFEELRRRAPSK